MPQGLKHNNFAMRRIFLRFAYYPNPISNFIKFVVVTSKHIATHRLVFFSQR